MKVTNKAAGLQGIHTLSGVVFLKPGETRDGLALTEDHARRADRLPFISVEGEPEPASPPAELTTLTLSMDDSAFRARFEQMTAEIGDLSERLRDSRAGNDELVSQLDAAKAEVEALKEQLAAKKNDGGAGEGGPSVATVAEVLAMADDVPFMTFKSAASKLLGDATPSKKDEIVAALEELATKP